MASPCVALKSENDDDRSSVKTAEFSDFKIEADDKPLRFSVKAGDAPKVEGIQDQLDIKIPTCTRSAPLRAETHWCHGQLSGADGQYAIRLG